MVLAGGHGGDGTCSPACRSLRKREGRAQEELVLGSGDKEPILSDGLHQKITTRRTDWMSWNEWGTKLPELLGGRGGGRSSSLLADGDEGSVGGRKVCIEGACT